MKAVGEGSKDTTGGEVNEEKTASKTILKRPQSAQFPARSEMDKLAKAGTGFVSQWDQELKPLFKATKTTQSIMQLRHLTDVHYEKLKPRMNMARARSATLRCQAGSSFHDGHNHYHVSSFYGPQKVLKKYVHQW